MIEYGKPQKEVIRLNNDKRKGSKGRTVKTYQNKLRKLTSRYNRLFKNSQKAKSKLYKKKKLYFCDKVPTFNDYSKANKLKESNNNK